MDSLDNVRERIEALEQQMNVMGAHTRTVERRLRWWRGIAYAVSLVSLVSLAHPSQAADFTCAAGDVTCLINTIATANMNGETNTVTLEASTYMLRAVNNDTDGPNGLPSITSHLTMRGYGAGRTFIERDTTGPHFRIFHIAAMGTLRLEGVTVKGGSTEAVTSHRPDRGCGDLDVTAIFGGTGSIAISNTFGGCIEMRGGSSGIMISNSIENSIFNQGTWILTNNAIGGDLENNGGILTATNNTIRGTVLNLHKGTITSINNTIGGGIRNQNGTVLLLNTILALQDDAFCSGDITSLGNNLIRDINVCPINLRTNLDSLMIGDLTGSPELGDFTETARAGSGHFPLLPTSPAIDAGNNAVCLVMDQLGQPRVGPCDIGAIEFQYQDDH